MKKTYYFKVAKNLDKGGAWLASYSIKEPEVQNDGSVKGCAAFSSAAPAKRWSATVVGRNRLTWVVSEDKKSMTSSLEVKA
jgi:hypothetical protein